MDGDRLARLLEEIRDLQRQRVEAYGRALKSGGGPARAAGGYGPRSQGPGGVRPHHRHRARHGAGALEVHTAALCLRRGVRRTHSASLGRSAAQRRSFM
jgi:hypothetical protein